MLWATHEDTLLNHETIQQVLHLLEQGYSRRQIAELSDISVWSVQKIVNGKHSLIKPSKPVTNGFTSQVNSDSRIRIPLELRGDVLRRYLDIRNQKLAGLSNS
jgi:transposase